MAKRIYRPETASLQLPELWLPGKPLRDARHPCGRPSPWSRGLGRRCCCLDPCSNCSGTTPTRMELVISGVIDGTCNECDDGGDDSNGYNGTKILIQNSVNPCLWEYEPTTTFCTAKKLAVKIHVLSGYAYVDVGVISDLPTTDSYHTLWRKDMGYGASPIDCLFEDESIPVYAAPGVCDADDSTCLLTAL